MNKDSNSLRFSIQTYGCTFNRGDSSKIKKILEKEGYIESDKNSAKIIIINTCAVKHSTHMKLMYLIKKIVKKNKEKRIIITGCLPQIDKKTFLQIRKILQKVNGCIIHPHNISNFARLIEQKGFFEYRPKIPKSKRDKSYITPFQKSNRKQSIIQISEGCNNQCAYCCTTNARGKLVSYDFDQIIKQAKSLVKREIKELFITSQDLGNYSYKNYDLFDLLTKISKIKGDFKIRLGMMNPEYLVGKFKHFKSIFRDEKFYRFLHLPVQSGSNFILSKMNRHYKISEVNKILLNIKNFDKKFTIATDIIVGFPYETKKDFNETKRWLRKWKPHILNISKFSTRPETKAKKYPQIHSKVIKKRSKELSKIYANYSRKKNQKWMGWEGKVFFNEIHKKRKYPFMGRNDYYIPIMTKKGTLWTHRTVKIENYQNHSLIGRIINQNRV